MRLDIPAGTAVRFEPGDSKTVTLCSIAGKKIISGGNSLASGPVELGRMDDIITKLVQQGFAHVAEPGALEISADTDISRETYISMFGPTVGDKVRLGDTALWIEVERDDVYSRHFFRSYSLILFYLLDRIWRRSKVRWRCDNHSR